MRDLIIDLDAIEANLNTFRKRAPGAKILAVVKANAYGHGLYEVALKLETAKVDYFGVADVDEALQLREGGIETPVLAWLHDPNDRFTEAVAANIDLGVANLEQLERIADAARITGKVAKVHLKVDTGLSRNGSTIEEWPTLVAATVDLIGQQLVEAVGIFSHLSSTSEADDRAQIAAFDAAVEQGGDGHAAVSGAVRRAPGDVGARVCGQLLALGRAFLWFVWSGLVLVLFFTGGRQGHWPGDGGHAASGGGGRGRGAAVVLAGSSVDDFCAGGRGHGGVRAEHGLGHPDHALG